MTASARAALAATVALVAAGCGSSSHPSSTTITDVIPKPTSAAAGTKTFRAAGIALTFRFPSAFVPIPLVTKRHVGHVKGASHAAVGVGPYDLLIVSRFPGLPIAVTASNLSVLKSNFDGLMSRVFERSMNGQTTTLGGLPAIVWPRVPVVGLPVAASTQPANVFVGKDEYELECQATAARLAVVERACREMFATLKLVR